MSLIELEHIPATEQAADVLTKPLGITKHAESIKLMAQTPLLTTLEPPTVFSCTTGYSTHQPKECNKWESNSTQNHANPA